MLQPYPEVMLRRLSVEDALLKLEQFLDGAYLGGSRQVRIVHGKGTGVLRSVVQERLHRHPLVRSYRAGQYGEGGSGVTIAELIEE